MATMAAQYVTVPVRMGWKATTRVFAKESKYEFLKLMRTRAFSLAVLGFPVMFYLLFGLTNRGTQGGVEIGKYLMAGYACSGMVSAALFGIGVGMATERAQGWLEVKRASPMPPLAYLLAKCVTAQAFGVVVVALLMTLGFAFTGLHMTLREGALLLAMPLVAAVPFAAMSLLIALVVPANSAAGVVNLIYMPMAVLSGFWLPLRMLPKWMQAAAPVLPTYHLGQLALSIFGYAEPGHGLAHWGNLLGFTLLMLGAGWAVWVRKEGQN